MIDHDSPVTQDELHAYVDGAIPADRREAVEAWLATHPDDAASVAQWRALADSLRARYGAVASEPVPARFNLERLALSEQRSWRSVAAAAVIAALLGAAGGWIAHGVVVAPQTGIDAYITDALDAHKLYVVDVRHPVEVSGAERTHLVQWLSKRLDHQLRAPELDSIGLSLVGGRLLPGPSGASAFFMYETPSGERFTVYCASAGSPESAMHFKAESDFAAFYWVERGLAYVVSGPPERQRLWTVAQAFYDQIDKGKPNGG
jgi:anti-sigma factor RsiW